MVLLCRWFHFLFYFAIARQVVFVSSLVRKIRVFALHCGRCTSQRQTVNFKQVSFLVGDLSECGREGWGANDEHNKFILVGIVQAHIVSAYGVA
jgi:hypothetical protein